MTNPGATQDDAAIVEVEKLRAIEHAAWHALDDSGELASGDVIITKDNFAALCSLLLREQQAEIARLRAENERLSQDAARYRWLRQNWTLMRSHATDNTLRLELEKTRWASFGVDVIDTAIDAARKGETHED